MRTKIAFKTILLVSLISAKILLSSASCGSGGSGSGSCSDNSSTSSYYMFGLAQATLNGCTPPSACGNNTCSIMFLDAVAFSNGWRFSWSINGSNNFCKSFSQSTTGGNMSNAYTCNTHRPDGGNTYSVTANLTKSGCDGGTNTYQFSVSNAPISDWANTTAAAPFYVGELLKI